MGQDYSITGQASPPDTTGNSSTTGNNLICDGSHWQYPALIAGSTGAGGTAVSCAAGTAGAIEWTGTVFQGCNGTSWGSLAAGGSGTVNSGAQYQNAYYSATGSAVSGDATITTDAGHDFILTTGTLAIGTTTVTNAINLKGSAAQKISMVNGTTVGNNLTLQAGGGLTGGTNENAGNLILASGVSTGTGTSSINFNVYPAGSTGSTANSPTTAMTIASTGNVSIGSPTSNQDAMDVTNTGNANGIYVYSQATGFYYALKGQADGAANTGAAVRGDNTGTGNTGYAGYFLNTATSGTNYGVYGTDASASGYGGYFTNTTSTGVALFCSSTLSTGCEGNQTWHSTSDIRLKERIEALSPERGLDAIMKLRPVTFHWKDRKLDQGQRIGLIAQEVEPVYPEIVGTGPDGMKSIGYSDLTVPLIKAVQEQQAEIAALKAANDNMQHELDALKAELRQ